MKISLAATTLTTVFYVVRKERGIEVARQWVGELLRLFDVIPVDGQVLGLAMAHPSRDFEDAVQDASAQVAGIGIVVTRDPRGFAGSGRRIVDAAAHVAELEAAQGEM